MAAAVGWHDAVGGAQLALCMMNRQAAAAHGMLSGRHHYARSSPLQIRRAVLDGRRPPVPQREELPGPDNAGFAALEDYCALMR